MNNELRLLNNLNRKREGDKKMVTTKKRKTLLEKEKEKKGKKNARRNVAAPGSENITLSNFETSPFSNQKSIYEQKKKNWLVGQML